MRENSRPQETPGDGSDGLPPWHRIEGKLISAARAVRQAYDRCLSELGVNLSQASVLANLGNNGPLTQVELARRIGTSRARVGVYVDMLESEGAVERQADPTDRRVWLVSLTSDGVELWNRTIDIDHYVRRHLRVGTTAAQREQLEKILEQLLLNADAIPIAEDIENFEREAPRSRTAESKL